MTHLSQATGEERKKYFQWHTFMFSSFVALCLCATRLIVYVKWHSAFLPLALQHQCQIAPTDWCSWTSCWLRGATKDTRRKNPPLKQRHCFLCRALHVEMSRQHSRTSYQSQQARTFTDYCMPLGSDRNESSHLLLFRCRRRECFGEGPPLRHATLRLSCSLAASCVSASTLLVAMVTRHIFAQSLLRMGSAKWKTLKQVMFGKNLCGFLWPFIPEMLFVPSNRCDC